MAKWMTVAAHEYRQNVRRKGFIIALVALPLFMIAVGGLVFLFLSRGGDHQGLGVVDQAGIADRLPATLVITDTVLPDVPVVRFASPEMAAEALSAQTIDAYVVVPADYLATLQLQGFSADGDLSSANSSALTSYLRRALAASYPNPSPERVEDPLPQVLAHTLGSQREVTEEQSFMLFFTPYLFGLFLMISVFSSSSYLMTALVEEKENRVMEILSTSLRPLALMTGKVVGLGLLGLTQIGVWSASVVGLFTLARSLPAFSLLQKLSIPVDVVVFALIIFVPTYLLVAASLSTIGAAVTAVQEGQQLSGIISLLMVSPLFLLAKIVAAPNALFAVALSLAPFTAPMVILQRIALTDVPMWQMVAAVLVQALFAVLMMWVAAQVLRVGMLRYGKRLSLREIGRALRRQEVVGE